MYAVRLRRGGPWDWSRGLREQDGWDEHARFMDALVAEGMIVLGGVLEGGRDTLHAMEAPSEAHIRARLAQDPWAPNGMLTIASIEQWTILLDGRAAAACRDVTGGGDEDEDEDGAGDGDGDGDAG